MYNKLLQKLAEYNKGNSSRYRLAYIFGLASHIFFLVLFIVLGVTELMLFNIFSISLYIIGSFLLYISKKQNNVIWAILLYLEIVAHAVMCCIFVGWNFGFSMFAMTVIPIMFFLLYMDEDCKHPIIDSTILAILNVTVMFISRIYCYSHEPVYTLQVEIASSVSTLNMVLADFILFLFSMLFILKISTDRKQLIKQNDELIFLANYDPLTKLRNRHHMAEVFTDFEKGTKPYCVVLGDIDDFKHVNDTYGHHAGDEVLKTVSGIILRHADEIGAVCRWGGEEILFIMMGDTEQCYDINEAIRKEIEKTVVSVDERMKISVTMTFGFCDYGDATTIEKLISIADKRLYKGKKSGKNCIVRN